MVRSEGYVHNQAAFERKVILNAKCEYKEFVFSCQSHHHCQLPNDDIFLEGLAGSNSKIYISNALPSIPSIANLPCSYGRHNVTKQDACFTGPSHVERLLDTTCILGNSDKEGLQGWILSVMVGKTFFFDPINEHKPIFKKMLVQMLSICRINHLHKVDCLI